MNFIEKVVQVCLQSTPLMELEVIGGSYHITPDYWGDCSIIIDEELAIKAMLGCFEDADEKEE